MPKPRPQHRWFNTNHDSIHEYTPQKGDTVVECGAFRGGRTLKYAENVGKTGLVYAIEAVPDEYESLTLNTSKTYQIIPILAALDSEERMATLMIGGEAVNSLITGVVTNGKRIKVKTQTLDVTLVCVPYINFLTVQTNGTEMDVLHGAKEVLKRTKNIAVICMYRNHDEIKEFLEANGFKVTMPWLPSLRDYKTFFKPFRPWVFGEKELNEAKRK